MHEPLSVNLLGGRHAELRRCCQLGLVAERVDKPVMPECHALPGRLHL